MQDLVFAIFSVVKTTKSPSVWVNRQLDDIVNILTRSIYVQQVVALNPANSWLPAIPALTPFPLMSPTPLLLKLLLRLTISLLGISRFSGNLRSVLVKLITPHSLIPYTQHAAVIAAAVKHKKHVVTTSYVSPAMEAFDAAYVDTSWVFD